MTEVTWFNIDSFVLFMFHLSREVVKDDENFSPDRKGLGTLDRTRSCNHLEAVNAAQRSISSLNS